MENYRHSRVERAILAGTGLLAYLLAGCGTAAEVDDRAANESEAAFIAEARSVTVYPGKAAEIPQIQDDMRDEYDDYSVYEQQDDLDDDLDNGMAFYPRRFITDFSKGDGSGADTVCEDLQVPESATYVQATTTSDKQSWLFYNGDQNTAHICYPSGKNPHTVMVWAGNQAR